MGEGVTFTTAQIVALIVGSISVIGTLAGMIHKQDLDKLRDQSAAHDVRLKEQRDLYEQRIRDSETACTRVIVEKDAYIARANARMDKQDTDRERQAVIMEEALATARKQAQVSEAMYAALAGAATRSHPGDD